MASSRIFLTHIAGLKSIELKPSNLAKRANGAIEITAANTRFQIGVSHNFTLLLSPSFYGHWHSVPRPQGDEALRFDGMAGLET